MGQHNSIKTATSSQHSSFIFSYDDSTMQQQHQQQLRQQQHACGTTRALSPHR
jgi:hypothetical protein